jgi:hypothetical protein
MRAGRRTNLALLVLLPAAFATGWLAFGTGTVWPARIVTIGHAVFGFGVLALVPWKQLIVRRGLKRSGGPRAVVVKVFSALLAVSVLLSLAGGFAQSYAGTRTYAGLTAMQVHVGAALVATPLFIAHLWTRPQRVRVTDLSRRNALRLGGLLGVGAIGYVAAEGLAIVAGLPGRDRRATGSYEVGTDDPDRMPYVAWLFDQVPVIDPASYRLAVRGSPTVGYQQLLQGSDVVRATIDCTGGWYATQTWRGVRLDRLLPPIRDGQVIVVTSATGYRRRFPAAEASSLYLATHVAGRPLDEGHGAPVRLVAPGRRGFWWVKWVTGIALEDGLAWWQSPFPLQ